MTDDPSPEEAMLIAIDRAGSAGKLADELTRRGQPITRNAISQWTRVPIARAQIVSEITGVPVTVLRPDIWPPPPPP